MCTNFGPCNLPYIARTSLIYDLNLQVWKSILERSTSDEIGVAVAPLFQSMAWLWLLVAPCSSPIELNLLVPPSPGATVCKLM